MFKDRDEFICFGNRFALHPAVNGGSRTLKRLVHGELRLFTISENIANLSMERSFGRRC